MVFSHPYQEDVILDYDVIQEYVLPYLLPPNHVQLFGEQIIIKDVGTRGLQLSLPLGLKQYQNLQNKTVQKK